MMNNYGANCNASVSTNKNTCVHSNFPAKLRRLKLEESVIRESLNKTTTFVQNNAEEVPIHYCIISSEYVKFSVAVKKNYNDLMQLFQDIKARTSSKDVIKFLDIDDIKKNTHDFEKSLQLLKLRLHTELNELKTSEKELNKQLNDIISNIYLERKPRTRTAKYTETVTSPVKLVMNSPYKSSAVQDFQEFMMHSKNRYGGWDEYSHNIFMDMWQKYLETIYPLFSDDIVSTIVKSVEFNLFLCKVMPKLLGVSNQEVIAHAKWYINYLHLKYRQKEAIDNWRSNRQMMSPNNVGQNIKKKSTLKNKSITMKNCHTDKKSEGDKNHKDKIEDANKARYFNRNCLCELQPIISKSMNDDETSNLQGNTDCDDSQVLHFLKPTKQWMVRCSSVNFKSLTNCNDVDNMKKLGIPSWRADL